MLYVVMLLIFFFFQAEDGIRDLVRSRGLGDVYKRQDYLNAILTRLTTVGALYLAFVAFLPQLLLSGFKAVSYTHLTLPTSDLV